MLLFGNGIHDHLSTTRQTYCQIKFCFILQLFLIFLTVNHPVLLRSLSSVCLFILSFAVLFSLEHVCTKCVFTFRCSFLPNDGLRMGLYVIVCFVFVLIFFLFCHNLFGTLFQSLVRLGSVAYNLKRFVWVCERERRKFEKEICFLLLAKHILINLLWGEFSWIESCFCFFFLC